MKRFLSLLASVAIVASAFGQAGENLPGFKELYATATTPSNGVNCIQTLTFGATITSGTFTLGFEGRTTAAITWSATNNTLVANIDAALEALTNIGTGGVTTAAGTIVAGVNGTVTVTHTGNRAKQIVPAMTVTDNSLVGAAHTLTAAITTAGVDADGRILRKGAVIVALDTGVSYQNTGTPLNPTWGRVGDQGTEIAELTELAAVIPTAAVADLGAATSHAITDNSGGTASTSAIADLADGTTYATDHAAIENNFATLAAELALLRADISANRSKVNDSLAKQRTAGIITP